MPPSKWTRQTALDELELFEVRCFPAAAEVLGAQHQACSGPRAQDGDADSIRQAYKRLSLKWCAGRPALHARPPADTPDTCCAGTRTRTASPGRRRSS